MKHSTSFRIAMTIQPIQFGDIRKKTPIYKVEMKHSTSVRIVMIIEPIQFGNIHKRYQYIR